jgi:hypothetical protein
MWYRIGTASVTNNSDVVTGTNTYWGTQVKTGDIFVVDYDTIYEIKTIDSNTQITLSRPYEGATESDISYSIIRNFTSTTNADVATSLLSLLDNWQLREDELKAWMAGTVDGGPSNDGQYPLTDQVGNTYMVACPAYIQALSNSAVNWATTAEDIFVDPANYPGEYSARHWAAKAQDAVDTLLAANYYSASGGTVSGSIHATGNITTDGNFYANGNAVWHAGNFIDNHVNWDTSYTHSQAAHAPSNAQKNSDIIKSEVEAVLTGNISSHTHSYLPTAGGTVSGDVFVSGLAKGGFPFAPNMIRNSYMSILDGTIPRGFEAYGTSYLIVEATSPLAKGFEGRYVSTAYHDANLGEFVATPDLAVDSAASYWYGNYNKGPRIQRGGLYDGWGSYNGGRILKVTNNPAVTWQGYDTTAYHAAVTLPIDSNALGARWLFTCWVHIAKGECFGVGADAGYKCKITPPNSVSKTTTDAGPQGWYRYSAMVSSSQITKLEALAMSMGFIPDSNGDLEVYLALPYLQNLMYQGTNLDAWVGSLSDTLYRGGFLFDFQSKTLKIGGDTMNGAPATESLEVVGNIVATGGDSTDWNTAYSHSQSAHAPSDANNYIHHTQSSIGIDTSGIEVLDTLVVDTEGHVTSATKRSIQSASTTLSGVVQLNDTTSSTSTTQAATANSVKSAYDLANAALPKAGGTLTGPVILDNQTVGGDGTWDDSGIIIKNNNATAAEVAVSFQNAPTGSNYWITGLNQDTNMSWAYGTSFINGNVKMSLTATGTLTLGGDINWSGGSSIQANTAYAHSQVAHSPADAQKNSDILQSEVEAVLVGTISTHRHANATQSEDGYLSAADKVRLDNIADSANNYVHHAQSAINIDTSGIEVIDTIDIDAEGHATSVTKRSIQSASTTLPGVVQLNDTINSESTTQAATASAVKMTFDLANAALPKAGGTLTGPVILDNSTVGGDGTWDDSGIIIRNNHATPAEVAVSFQNASTGSNYWITGINQGTEYVVAYGTSYVSGNAKLVVSSVGNLTATGVIYSTGSASNSMEWADAYTHSQSAHAPSDAQKNSDILKSEIEAALIGDDITSHGHYKLVSYDTRDNSTLPEEYDKSLELHFKRATSIDAPPGIGTYRSVVGVRAWGDDSGGHGHELAFDNSGTIGYRWGDDAGGWGTWTQLWHSGNFTDNHVNWDTAYTHSQDPHSYLPSSGGTVSGTLNVTGLVSVQSGIAFGASEPAATITFNDTDSTADTEISGTGFGGALYANADGSTLKSVVAAGGFVAKQSDDGGFKTGNYKIVHDSTEDTLNFLYLS